MNQFRKFMSGRYGSDSLNIALIILSFILSFSANIFRQPVLSYIGYIPLALCIFRMFSKNIYKRRNENTKFIQLTRPVHSFINKTKMRFKYFKTHKYFACPNCKTQVRVPKGKGKVNITCPKCKTKFIKKT